MVLTGWNHMYNVNHPRYFKIPYSSHSNYKELDQFVKALKPKRLIFTVPESHQHESGRINFQKKLLTYTEEGKDTDYMPIVNTIVCNITLDNIVKAFRIL